MRKNDFSVVGGGLVGSLLSIYLARTGKKVSLYERRPDMRKESISAGRSINLAISTRGIHALKELGLDQEVLSQAIPMKGRMIHSKKGELTFQRYGKDDSECIHSISRGGLNKTLLTAAEATGNVEVFFNHRLDFCDPSDQTLTFQDGKKIFSNKVFGTDGSASAVRAAVMRQRGSHSTEDVLDYGYKEFHIDPAADGGFRMEKNALHIWPRGNFMLIALPNFDGSYTVTLFLPFHGETSFESIQTDEALERFFKSEFPDVVPLIANLKKTFHENPTGKMVTVKCSPWNLGEWALLLGDAAHAIVPFFGQGMNCGFEDCSLFMKDPAQSFAKFGAARKVDADAIADLAVENFTEMRDKVGNPEFLKEKEVEKLLEKEFPQDYQSKYRLVTFTRAPYRHALAVGKIQESLLRVLCQGLQTPQQVDFIRAKKMIREMLPALRQESELK